MNYETLNTEGKLYALLVGINNYPVGVSPLQGCVNDVEEVNKLLNNSFQRLSPQIVSLTNEQATRQNIIDAFRTHLCQATVNDSVLFYYSGHGSRENAPQEFWKEFPTHKNETLVCYDSRLAGGFDLADKELAILISEVAKQNPHIVVCLDCCHAGSGTRDSIDLVRVKQVEKEGSRRGLEHYIDGFYSKQFQSTGKIDVPQSKHILLAACQENERAYETSANRGLFTLTLQNCLKDVQSLSYSDLFNRIAVYVREKESRQHPNVEFLGGFNPHVLFLTGTETDRLDTFPITYDSESRSWRAQRGNIHGLAIEYNKPATIWIFSPNTTSFTEKHLFTKGKITGVQMLDSIVIPEATLDNQQQYVGVLIDGNKKYATIYSGVPIDDLSVLSEYLCVEKAFADYWVLQSGNLIQVIHRTSRKIITEKEHLFEINQVLRDIVRWENIKQLNNPKSRLRKEEIEFSLAVEEQSFVGDDIQLILDQNESGEVIPKHYTLSVANNAKVELYFKVIFVSPLYGIKELGKSTIPANETGVIVKNRLGFYKEQYVDNENNCLFKLIVSTKEIDLSFFVQENFSINKDYSQTKSIEDSQIRSSKFLDEFDLETNPSFDWLAKDLKLRLVKNNATIGKEDIVLADGSLTFKAHQSFQAKVTLSSLYHPSRSIGNESLLKSSITINSLAILNLSPQSKSVEQKQQIELEDIEGEVDADKPLILAIQNQEILPNEIVLPVMVNGDEVVVIGTSKALENNEREVYIERIPEINISEKGTRSLGRAIKFCLMKLVFKTAPDSYFALNWVDYEQAKPVRTNLNLTQKITEAKNIVLFIHGIIGDTEGMIPFAQKLVKPTENSEAKYDLVLTFDYECLNTPIEKIAENLAIVLSEHGIDGNTDKKLTIVTHSMGGLVSRVLIEKLGKAGLVKKLIMAGTPNGGSVFGNAPSYISMTTDVLTLGLSSALVAPYLAWAGGLIVALKKSSMLTVTLEQMKRNSDLINSLYIQNDPHVPYFILAGNIDLYNPNSEEGTWFDKLCKRLVLGVGNLFHEGKQHDIAVYTKDIMKVNSNRQPQVIFQEVGCPHIFYFDEPQSKEILYQWLEV
ncbi:caspase family protein [Flectobacillus roseus]|uniref:caspase family protein n=1 Tax=Flectobacillus roseus TaxID=502259 RepID=UPI0024B7A97E|nr:caspase family protein [Flectobacillus roseus]MDI9868571.1 caspase family protein [Flectobacillus roseus]